MPKGKRKGKASSGSGFKNRNDLLGTSDEDSLNDNASVTSGASESTIYEDGNMGEEVDETTQEDQFEEKLIDAIDGISQKSAQGRTNSLQAVTTCFTRKFIPELIIDRRLTLSDGIERCLKKGKGAEQAAAAQLAALLCVQLGACEAEAMDQICKDLIPHLMVVTLDGTMSPPARAKCCWALGVLSYLGNIDNQVPETMRTLQQVFAASYPKGDGSAPNVLPEVAALHAAALSAWGLLLTIVDVYGNSSLPTISQLVRLLDSAHLEVRMAAGEAITLLLEQGRLLEEDYGWEESDTLIGKLKALATDSHKYRAKKDRKTQRSSFRDILRYVEEYEPPNIQIKFGQEVLSLDSWSRKKQYDAFCQVLGPGMNLHLTENNLLRDILELGDKISLHNISANKQSKLERHLMNAANFKARSISRAKNRDKRLATISC